MVFYVTVTFKEDFVLKCYKETVTPMEKAEMFLSADNCRIIEKNENLIRFTVEGDTKEETEQQIIQRFTMIFAPNMLFTVCTIDVSSVNPEWSAGNFVRDIDKLVGWDEFKKMCDEMAMVAPVLHKNQVAGSFIHQNFLFSVNPGYGLTKALHILADLAIAVNLANLKKDNNVAEFVLAKETSGYEVTPDDMFTYLSNDENVRTLVCIDISAYSDKSHQVELKRFLDRVKTVNGDYMIVFNVPFLEPKALKEIEKTISDVFFLRTISVPPFNDDLLKKGAEQFLGSFGFTMAEDAWEVFFRRICEEKSDGRFYGIRTVETVIYEMFWEKAKTDALCENASEKEDKCICAADIKAICKSAEETEKSGYEELSELIGMEKITDKIKEIVAQVKTSLSNNTLDKPCLHMRFVGAPGTGKTTVARIIGKIFREEGILRNGFFFEYMARNLCAEYVGQTAPKTLQICRDAYGSVLFLDEAYSLYVGKSGSDNDFGREAVATLISEMENHRDDMVVIMAGYKDDMDTLMDSNAGLRSRMPFIIDFPSYSRQQLHEIFMLMFKKHFKYTEEFEAEAKKYFSELPSEYLESKEFANARFARNLYERTWSKAALRAGLSGEKEIVIDATDFLAARSEEQFSEKIAIKNKLGF